MSWLLALFMALLAGDGASSDDKASSGGVTSSVGEALPGTEASSGHEVTPCVVRCRYECFCFRTNGYRCLRTYTEPCEGKECWQCQDRITSRARQSCAIGEPVRSCFCKPIKI